MAKKNTTRIEPGDKLVLEVPVVASRLDMGKVTVTIYGTRFTFAEDNPEIRDVLKKAREKAVRGQRLALALEGFAQCGLKSGNALMPMRVVEDRQQLPHVFELVSASGDPVLAAIFDESGRYD